MEKSVINSEKKSLSAETLSQETRYGEIEIHIDGSTYPGKITEINEKKMTASFNSNAVLMLEKDNQPIADVGVYIENVLLERLNITIDNIKHVQGKYLVTASPADDKTASLFWKVKHTIGTSFYNSELRIKTEDIPRIPGRGIYNEDARLERLEFIRRHTPGTLKNVEMNSFDPQKLTSNIESFIGSIEIPVGVAGPLLINGANARGIYYSPLATSEGALVASVCRGAMAITRSGGASAQVLGQRMLRVPLFSFSDMKSAHFFSAWIRDHFNEIRDVTKQFSNYADLKELDPFVIGKTVHVHFVYETGDAAGQNMTTTCTWNACLWIRKKMEYFHQIRIENFMIDGNLSNDKKVTFQSLIKGRGIRAHAETFISSDVLKSVLKVTPEQMTAGYAGALAGSVQAGMIGANINVANVIAAIFTATGQDIASVHESSIAHFSVEPAEEGIYASILLPSLTIGTIGGGTNLTQQHECLEMIDCAGSGKSYRFAEIIASFALALELSTGAAIAGGQFASAHEKLGRNRPINHLKHSELNETFFTDALKEIYRDDHVNVAEAIPVKLEKEIGNSILSQLTMQKSHQIIGHFPYAIKWSLNSGPEMETDVMLKIKPTDREVIHMINGMGSLSDARLAGEMKKADGRTGFVGCHIRELSLSLITDERFTKYVPKTYGVFRNDEREIFIIVQEYMKHKEMVLMDSADDVSGWTNDHILTAIKGISEIHSIWYGKTDELKDKEWIGTYPTNELMSGFSRLWELLAVHANQEFPEWFGVKDLNMFRSIINDIPYWWNRIESMPATLIHNDFNPRNIAFRKKGDDLTLCAYDWELATIHLPQHDLVELLAFVLDESATVNNLMFFSDNHRHELETHLGYSIDPDLWWEGFIHCIKDFMINRLTAYIMVHSFKHYGFMERVYRTIRHFATILNIVDVDVNVIDRCSNKLSA